MSESKQERQRRKRAEKRKKKAREQAQLAQRRACEWRSYDAAELAYEHLEGGEIDEALRDAARAAALNPRDPEIAGLYADAAERAYDFVEAARALEHLRKLVEPDARLLVRLALLYVQTGDSQRAQATVQQARAALPRRMEDRKTWLALIKHVETIAAAQADEFRDSEQGELPLVEKNDKDEAGSTPQPAAPLEVELRPQRAVRSDAESVPERAGSSDAALAPERAASAEVEPAPQPAASPQPAAPSFLEIRVDVAGDLDGLEVLSSATFSDPEEVELAALAARIRDAESYQRLFAVERAQGLLPFSHQEETARKVLSVLLGRVLLADEVGLGKTIEAGIVLSEYLLRGRVESALVLVPPSLVGQWREELSTKFGIEARTTEEAGFRSDTHHFWSRSGVVIASLATARSPRHREFVTAEPWDLVIVDEAHALKNANTASYRVVSRITSRFLLLLTATPVENRVEELYNLVSLIRPGHLGGRAAFLKRFSDSRLRKSERARGEARALLGEVMVRNTRALSGVQLPPRFARTVLVSPEPAEGELYGHLAAALRALGPAGRTRLLLSVLLQEAGSSPFAVRATLERIRDRRELSRAAAEALAPAIQYAERPISTGKAGALLRVLDGAGEPAVVFTRYRATLAFLATVLKQAGLEHERIDGKVPAPLRNEAIARLRQRGGVLLSTEVGAEGLNLQFCRRIVNFDLPWNPMRIEQRIGRVHRIGQDHAVEVVNLCLAGSIEERILRILDERINLFELVVGEVEMILGYLEEKQQFSTLMLEAFADREAERREQSFARIADALAVARERYENVKRFDEDFFRDELGV